MKKIIIALLVCLFLVSCSNLQGGSINTPYPTFTAQPTFTPYPTYTPFPTPLPVTEKWHHYRITYSISLDGYRGVTKVWMPVPVDSVTQQGVKLLEVSPVPKDIYYEPKGNQIIYWQENIQNDGFKFSEQFEIYILQKTWTIKPEDVGTYDPDDPALFYLRPSNMMQSDNPEILAAAQEIVGEETNPYQKIQLIVSYLKKNMVSGGEKEDAVSVIRTKQVPACGAAAHIFVALSRAAGIPARIVSGVHSLRPGTYNWHENNFGTHLWTEFYLPNYGWIPADVLWGDGVILAEYQGNRIILSRDSDFNLGHDGKSVSWFHMPYVNNHQEENSDLILIVEFLGTSEHPDY
ncbi:MAG: transglutaminase domain-containing protein [Candidatus Hydrogenedentes bacterium]|nr:transglutaminase domain-containing protein [Candidatus Hydrogenedentota bacterium]